MIQPEVEDPDADDDDAKKGGGDEDDKYPDGVPDDEDDYIYDRNTKEGKAIHSFCEITKEDEYVAAKYLEPKQWSLQLGLSVYWDRTAAERVADTGFDDSGLIYSHGISFCGKDRGTIKYVRAKHATLKDEVMATRFVTEKNWSGLVAQCETLIKTDAMKKTKTNGNDDGCLLVCL